MPGLLERLIAPRIEARTTASNAVSTAPGGFSGLTTAPNLNQAYYRNVTINAGLRLLARQVAEPSFVGRRHRRGRGATKRAANEMRAQGVQNCAGARNIDRMLVTNGFTETVTDHPLVTLLNNPNPFMSGDELWGLTVVLDQWLAGNAYVLKGRTDLGNVQELWRLRPDRVKVIPDDQEFIAGYEYKVGQKVWKFPREDVIHIKTLNPDDPYYGVPLLLAVMDALSIDNDMRQYLRSYYRTNGMPGAVLTLSGKLTPDEREELLARKKRIFGGPNGSQEWLILDNTSTTFQALGLDRGLAAGLPKEIAAMVAAELSMAMGIPGSILGQLIGYESSSYANKRADWQVLWDITLTPQMEQLDNAINKAFLSPENPEFGGIDEIYSDLSTIPALSEDLDAIQERHRKNYAAGLASFEEARAGVGLDPDTAEGMFLVPTTGIMTPFERLGELPEATIAEPEEPAALVAAHFSAAFAKDVTPKVGRPPLLADPGARATYERAMALRAEHPTWSWLEVATNLGISERQLRRYRGQLE